MLATDNLFEVVSLHGSPAIDTFRISSILRHKSLSNSIKCCRSSLHPKSGGRLSNLWSTRTITLIVPCAKNTPPRSTIEANQMVLDKIRGEHASPPRTRWARVCDIRWLLYHHHQQETIIKSWNPTVKIKIVTLWLIESNKETPHIYEKSCKFAFVPKAPTNSTYCEIHCWKSDGSPKKRSLETGSWSVLWRPGYAPGELSCLSSNPDAMDVDTTQLLHPDAFVLIRSSILKVSSLASPHRHSVLPFSLLLTVCTSHLFHGRRGTYGPRKRLDIVIIVLTSTNLKYVPVKHNGKPTYLSLGTSCKGPGRT